MDPDLASYMYEFSWAQRIFNKNVMRLELFISCTDIKVNMNVKILWFNLIKWRRRWNWCNLHFYELLNSLGHKDVTSLEVICWFLTSQNFEVTLIRLYKLGHCIYSISLCFFFRVWCNKTQGVFLDFNFEDIGLLMGCAMMVMFCMIKYVR